MSITRDVTLRAGKYLENDQILLFIGARQAGKTTILKQLQEEVKSRLLLSFFLNLEDLEILNILDQSPKNIFKIIPIDLGKKSFVFIDEIQYLKNPTNFLKYLHDEYKDKIKILASGSSAFYLDHSFKDSLVGRKKIFPVHTLSFREFLRFKDEKELSAKKIHQLTLVEKEKMSLFLLEYMTYGGYPRVVLSDIEEKKEILTDIIYSYIKKDIFEANIRSYEVFFRLLKLLSGQIGSLVNSSELANTLGVSKSAIDNYLYVMQKSFHLQLIKPFYKNTRKEITKMPKVYFYDLGLRNALINNFETFEFRADKGPLTENLFFRNLLERYQVEEIRFWRTINQNEVDFVVGNLAFEIKSQKTKKLARYDFFKKKYPEIKLKIVSFTDLLLFLL